MGTAQDDTRLTPIHPERTLDFSLSICQLSFLSRAGMLYSLSHHVLLIYKIYKIILLGYSQIFANIHILRHDGLLIGICDTMVILGCLMGWVHLM